MLLAWTCTIIKSAWYAYIAPTLFPLVGRQTCEWWWWSVAALVGVLALASVQACDFLGFPPDKSMRKQLVIDMIWECCIPLRNQAGKKWPNLIRHDVIAKQMLSPNLELFAGKKGWSSIDNRQLLPIPLLQKCPNSSLLAIDLIVSLRAFSHWCNMGAT